MEIHRIHLYCSLTNQVFVETGTRSGADGYWFCAFDGTRSFVTADEIHERLADATGPRPEAIRTFPPVKQPILA